MSLSFIEEAGQRTVCPHDSVKHSFIGALLAMLAGLSSHRGHTQPIVIDHAVGVDGPSMRISTAAVSYNHPEWTSNTEKLMLLKVLNIFLE